MAEMVTITEQGQLTIPRFVRDQFGITKTTKAMIHVRNGQIIVEPKRDFWSVFGSLKSNVALTDSQLKTAREAFETDWHRNSGKKQD